MQVVPILMHRPRVEGSVDELAPEEKALCQLMSAQLRLRNRTGHDKLECITTLQERAAALQLWDPASGRAWGLYDAGCPLREVHQVVGRSNMWANVQRVAAPATLDWRLEVRRKWLPLLDGAHTSSTRLGTLQQAFQ